MSAFILSDIYIYPVKSLAGIRVDQWPVDAKGLQYDRKWMLIDNKGQFLSQRKLAKMALIHTQIEADHLVLSTQTSGSFKLPLNPNGGTSKQVQVWHDQCQAKTVSVEVDEWLSDFLERQCQLVYQPEESIRQVDQDYANITDQVGFSDGFPFLITSKASLNALNQAMKMEINMRRFRPNLVIANCDSYEEDSWREISINDIHFRLPKPCSRCIVPSIDPNTAVRDKEPLATLQRLRKWNNKTYFGQNAIHDCSGILTTGNIVNVIKTGSNQPPL